MLILKGASHEVNAVRFTPDGRGLFTSTWRGGQLWADWASGGKPVVVAELAGGAAFQAFSPDGRYVLGAVRGNFTLYDQSAGTTTVLDPKFPASSVRYVTFTPDGRRVITSRQSSLTPQLQLQCTQIEAPHPVVWNVPTRGLVARIVFLDTSRFVSLDNVGGAFVATMRDAGTGEAIGETRVSVPYWLTGLTTSPDRQRIIGYHTAKFLVYQSADLAAAPVVVRNTSRKAFSGLAFHPAGRYLAATSNDASVKLYDVATWEVTRTFDWSIGRLRSVAFSPDGTLAAAGGDKGLVVVWDFDE